MKIIYKTEIGIAIVHPTGEISIEDVLKKDVPEQYKLTAIIVEDDVIPSDRLLRDAWDLQDGKVIEDLEKSKEITKERLRAERKPLLEQLDIEYMRALENENDTSSIVTEKQRLRDITNGIDDINDVNNLKQLKVKE